MTNCPYKLLLPNRHEKNAANLARMKRSAILIVPTLRARRYTQVLPSQKCRHTGMDAGIQATDGNLTVVQVLHFGNVAHQSLPSLDAGFRHPCRNDGLPAFVYNDERWSERNHDKSLGYTNSPRTTALLHRLTRSVQDAQIHPCGVAANRRISHPQALGCPNSPLPNPQGIQIHPAQLPPLHRLTRSAQDAQIHPCLTLLGYANSPLACLIDSDRVARMERSAIRGLG